VLGVLGRVEPGVVVDVRIMNGEPGLVFSQADRAVGVLLDVTPERRIAALDVQMNREKLALFRLD
jgi:hypothetical protein